jgi:hypothetical protein
MMGEDKDDVAAYNLPGGESMDNGRTDEFDAISGGILYQSEQVRVWMDEERIGHIRIIRRVNFSTLIKLINTLTEVVEQESTGTRQVRIYIPASLKSIDSENLRALMEFAENCCNIRITLVET